ncbi:SLATT domain-containing protein [Streptomyces sp. NBC_00620]|uniref:SLATT domain-containing protein n=1 Tax=Streptomyces sp. NBC_00620 TaxID=2903666 RepID=UPI00224F9252|nr:SLATT domain-containing protein [Streptomyces sp. NBC_00620]MCX4974721.1 SLATT domain-containing protein [Streptomyces sp. NBC_00620]
MLAALGVAAIASAHPVLITSVSIALAAWLILALHCGYHLLRAYRWRERRRTEQQARERLAIPGDVPSPGSFPGVREIDEAQHAELKQTPDYQGRYRATGVKVAFLPTLAVGFITLQAIFFRTLGPTALGLAYGEALLLAVLVLVVHTNKQPSFDWVLSRIRAELLRREQYLRLAQVGPYLGMGRDSSAQIRKQRVTLIATGDLEGLERLASTADQDTPEPGIERPWVDSLWQAAATRTGSGRTGSGIEADPGLPDQVRDRARSYLYYRIGKQLMWFGLSTIAFERAERRITRTTQATVVAAVAVAVANAVLLSADRQHGGASSSIALLAAVLPALCTGLFATHELFAFRQLAVSYDYTRQELARCQSSLRALIGRFETITDDASGTTEFQALVLRTEAVLTLELQRWVRLVHKSRFDAAI